MNAQDPTHLQYRPDIDGLRAVAVLSVVGYHAFPDWFRGGFVGVDVFFVISGYLISTVILRALDKGQFRFREFYARRIRRIFPALVLVLAASFAFGWFTLLPREYAQLGKHVAGGASFISNFVLWEETGYFDEAAELKPLLHLWSLAIEEQFYILWPLLLFLAWSRRFGARGLALSLLLGSFCLNVYIVRTDAVAAFYSPATRFWELMVGSSLAYALSRTEHQDSKVAPARELAAVSGMALILVAVFGLNSGLAFPGYWAALPTAGAFLLISAGPEAWLSRRVLSHPAAVLVGLISYPLYLWHWPALSFVRILGSGTYPGAARLAAVVASVVAAWLTYRLVETPFRFGGHGSRNVLTLVLLMVAMGGAGLVAFKRRGLEFRILTLAPQLIRQYATLDYEFRTDARFGTCWLAVGDAGDKFSLHCLDGEGSRPVVLVWGDSHAARLYPGLRRALGDEARLAQYTRDGCLPIFDQGYENCASGNAFVLRKVRGVKPRTVILFAAWNRYPGPCGRDDSMPRRLDRTILELKRAGVAQVLVIGPAPQWTDALPRVLANVSNRDPLRRVPERTFFGLNPEVSRCDQTLTRLLGARPDVTYVSAWQTFCDSAGCLTRVDEEADGLTTWDYGHLTTRAAEYLARRLPIHPEP